MKYIRVIATVTIALVVAVSGSALVPTPVVLANDEGSNTEVEVIVVGENVNTNITLTAGNDLSVSVNGSGLANEDDLQYIYNSMGMSNSYMSFQITAAQDLLNSLKTSDSAMAVEIAKINSMLGELKTSTSNSNFELILVEEGLAKAITSIYTLQYKLDSINNDAQNTHRILGEIGKALDELHNLIEQTASDNSSRLAKTAGEQESAINELKAQCEDMQRQLNELKHTDSSTNVWIVITAVMCLAGIFLSLYNSLDKRSSR